MEKYGEIQEKESIFQAVAIVSIKRVVKKLSDCQIKKKTKQ